MRKEELRTYIENHESEMIEDLKSLIRIPSEKQAAEPGKPFGAPAAEALAQGIEILEKYGFTVTNYDNYAIAADFNQEEKGLDILAHLDVVPAGEGWQERYYLYEVPSQEIILNPALAPNNPGWE